MEFGKTIRYQKSFMREKVDGNTLPQEVEEGNVEYKLKLVDPPPERVEHLITQMKWRLAEGHGEAMYEVGVADDGELVGLSPSDMEASLSTLRYMSEQLNAEFSVIRRREGTSPSRMVAEVLVRKRVTDSQHFLEIRVAILGGVDAGKSTLLGVLTHSELDNGRGKSRLNLLRHRHEIVSGRTSSISQQIIGFDAAGGLVNYRNSTSTLPTPSASLDSSSPPMPSNTMISTWEQVCEVASKLITFLDTCGHPKYQRTTLSGITGSHPDYACVILGGTAGNVSEVPREHLGVAVGLGVPVFVVITKIDVADRTQLTGTIGDLLRILRSSDVRREPKVVQNGDDVVAAVEGLEGGRVVPIFLVSSVTGENMQLLIKFLNLLPKRQGLGVEEKAKKKKAGKIVEVDNVEFGIEEIYSVPSVGYVIGGVLKSGIISPIQDYAFSSSSSPIPYRPDQLIETEDSPPPLVYLVGPDRGRFVPIHINSIQRQRCPVGRLLPGQAGTLAITFPTSLTPTTLPADFRLRKGQVVIPQSPPSPHLGSVAWEFEADLRILHAPAASSAMGTQGVVYCGSGGQGARVIGVSGSEALGRRRRRTVSSEKDDVFELDDVLFDEDVVPDVMAPNVLLVTGGTVTVRFAFASEPEWVKVGQPVLFRGGQMGRVKCVGKVTRIFVAGGKDLEGQSEKKRRGSPVDGSLGILAETLVTMVDEGWRKGARAKDGKKKKTGRAVVAES